MEDMAEPGLEDPEQQERRESRGEGQWGTWIMVFLYSKDESDLFWVMFLSYNIESQVSLL